MWEGDRAQNFSAGRMMRSYDLNVFGPARGLEAVLPGMIARKRGQVVLMASVAGYGGLPRALSYCSSKSALITMAECLKLDLDKAGVKVQLVCPGFIDTPLTQGNKFPMPFLMKLDDAAEALVAGLGKSGFRITFPKRFTRLVGLINLLPYRLYFRVIRKVTGL
jgi:short-subunit dehydrogenase